MSPDEALLVAHGITEYAIDIRLGSEVDPLLGRKLATAARSETKRFADLLVRAFGADYADACFAGDTARAAAVLIAAERRHRKDMIYLGQAISRPGRLRCDCWPNSSSRSSPTSWADRFQRIRRRSWKPGFSAP